MKHFTFSRIAVAAALFAATGLASAASYFVVVPSPGKVATSPIAVSLQAYTLPDGLAGARYEDFDFHRALVVTGDSSFNPAYVRWYLASGELPAGMTLSTATGILSGTPPADTSASFEVQALYKSKTDTHRYVLTIKARGSVATLYGVSTLDWGEVARTDLPQQRNVTLGNAGDRPMTVTAAGSGPFALVANTCTNVVPGGTCSLAFRLTDTPPGDYGPVSVSVAGASAGPVSLKLASRVLGPLVAADTATALDFGAVTQSDTAGTRAVTWRNTGNAAMSLSAGSIAAPFSLVSNTCANVSPGATCVATFTMAAATPGTYGPSSVSFQGGGTAAGVTLNGQVLAYNLPASLNPVVFGNVLIGTSATRVVTVTNASSVRAAVTVGALTAPFSQTSNCPSALDAGASCDVTVKYSPTDSTPQARTLMLPGLNIPVSGTGDKIGIETAGAGRRWKDGTYAASCKDYLSPSSNYQYAGVTGDGVYTIAPAGSPLDVYCDMSTDGGGWMLFTNSYRNGQGPLDLMAGTNVAAARTAVSGVGSGGTLGLNSFPVFPFATTRIVFIAGDNPNQRATFYKGITRANLASWGQYGAVEPDTSKAAVCTDLAMTQNCTSRPFDHDYYNNGTQTGFTMMWGVTVAKYGYTTVSYQPVHGTAFAGGNGWCSTTGNVNNNAWNDSYGDGHWGNGLQIWLR